MTGLRNARTRLMLFGALLSALAMGLVLGLVYWTANRVIETETRNTVDAELTGLADSYGSLGVLGLARAIERRITSLEEPDALYLLTDARGQVIAGNLGAWPPTVEPGSGWVALELIRVGSDRVIPISAASIHLRNGERLLVGRDASARQRFDRVLGRSLALALLAAIGLSLANGWLLGRLVFSRIGEISDTAGEIMSGDLSRRIPLRDSGDEFDRLGVTLNDMLDRIEALVANLRTTTDSLAHDLRSPLTRLRTHVETLTDPELDADARDAIAERALREVDHLLRVFADLTEIARAEAGLGRSEFETVDLAALAEGVVDLYEPLAEDLGLSIRLSGAVTPVLGHKALLSQALSNLLDNAIRYAPEGSEINLTLDDAGDSARLSVRDRGPGVPAESREQVLKPFVTLDPSRTGGTSGLGLALVASVAALHDGKVAVWNAAPGLGVTLTLPHGSRGADTMQRVGTTA